jgi:hypothetical protein
MLKEEEMSRIYFYTGALVVLAVELNGGEWWFPAAGLGLMVWGVARTYVVGER